VCADDRKKKVTKLVLSGVGRSPVSSPLITQKKTSPGGERLGGGGTDAQTG